jgi:hypothetical protein
VRSQIHEVYLGHGQAVNVDAVFGNFAITSSSSARAHPVGGVEVVADTR